METPAERLKTARERAGFADAKSAAKAFGWSYEAYKKHESGDNGLRPTVAEKYAAAFNVAPEWLLYGSSLPTQSRTGSVPRFRFLPLYVLSEVPTVQKPLPNHVRTTAVDAGQDIGPKAFCVELEDVSMVVDAGSGPDSFAPGDIVTIDPDKPIRPGDFALFVYATTGVAVFRRVRAHAGGNYPVDLVPLNSAWAVETVTSPEQGRFIGRMIRHIRVYP